MENQKEMEKERIGNSEDETNYLKSLSEKEMKAYLIAKNHLGSSFGLEKSIGFLHWKNKS
jgi:hypothetical protein